MSLFYYQLCRLTGKYVKKQEQPGMQPEKPKKEKFNKTILSRGTSRKRETEFVGVSFCPKSLKWRAYITVKGVLKTLGVHDTDKQAAIAYDKEAAKIGRKTNILQPCI